MASPSVPAPVSPVPWQAKVRALLFMVAIYYGVQGLTIVCQISRWIFPPDYPLTFANMFGWLSFEALLPGPSEELLFRGLIHTYLARSWKGIWKLGRLEIPIAGILTTLIFCLAHVSLFKAPHVSWTQQAFAFGLGIYYSAVYHRTGSLLNPMLAHNFWDVIAVASWYLLSWRFH